jgi:hypothetical protein
MPDTLFVLMLMERLTHLEHAPTIATTNTTHPVIGMTQWPCPETLNLIYAIPVLCVSLSPVVSALCLLSLAYLH